MYLLLPPGVFYSAKYFGYNYFEKFPVTNRTFALRNYISYLTSLNSKNEEFGKIMPSGKIPGGH